MLGPLLSLCVLLQLLSASLGLVDARPAVLPHGTLVMRQNTGGLTQPVSVQTQNILQSQSGPMMQQCTLIFTPVTGPDGEELVQEEKACTVTLMNSSVSVSSSATTAGTTSATSTVSTTSIAATSSSVSASTFSSSASSSLAQSSVTSTSASTSSTGVTSSASSSAVPPSSTSLPASATSTSLVVSTASTTDLSTVGPANGAGASPSSLGQASLSSSSASPSGTSAADSAAFKLPGTSLSVLPIGLAVFAGISVIALIVVGLVTYERTKYRRKFRQQKLAESGAAMGYGGMGAA